MNKYLNPADRLLMVLLAIWTTINLFQGAYTELANDEAYYWVLSSDVGFGYYDHPPMFGWLVALSSFIFGDTEFGVRAITILLQPIYLFMFWRLIPLKKPSKSLALVYALVAFSVPLLQLYGFVVTPDAPLLFCTALLLWCYKRFLRLEDDFSKKSLATSAMLGLAAAAICYAKYHGVLVIGFIVLSNIRVATTTRFYIAVAVAALAFMPHILWQYSHDWVSLDYHLNLRAKGFEWENVWIYLLNLVTTFNPLFMPIFVALILKKSGLKAKDLEGEELIEWRFARALKWITWGFVLFFARSLMSVHVQAQWLIPLVFPVLYFLVLGAQKRLPLKNYLLKVSGVFVLLFIGVRVFIVSYADRVLSNELFGNEAYGDFARELNYRPFISNANYVTASKMRFYGQNPAFAHPDVNSRSSHYQFMDMDRGLYNRPVAIEISDEANNSLSRQAKDSLFEFVQIHQYHIWYDTISNYIPSRDVRLETVLPEKVLSLQDMMVDVHLENPYSHDIPLGAGRDRFELSLRLVSKENGTYKIVVPMLSDTLPARGEIDERVRIIFPEDIDTGAYQAAFTLTRYPYGSWYNSERMPLVVVNPNES